MRKVVNRMAMSQTDSRHHPNGSLCPQTAANHHMTTPLTGSRHLMVTIGLEKLKSTGYFETKVQSNNEGIEGKVTKENS